MEKEGVEMDIDPILRENLESQYEYYPKNDAQDEYSKIDDYNSTRINLELRSGESLALSFGLSSYLAYELKELNAQCISLHLNLGIKYPSSFNQQMEGQISTSGGETINLTYNLVASGENFDSFISQYKRSELSCDHLIKKSGPSKEVKIQLKMEENVNITQFALEILYRVGSFKQWGWKIVTK